MRRAEGMENNKKQGSHKGVRMEASCIESVDLKLYPGEKGATGRVLSRAGE